MPDFRILGAGGAPLAITAEARDDLRARLAALSPEILARAQSGARYKAEESDGTIAGTGGLLRVVDGVGVIEARGPLFKATGGISDWIMALLGGGTSYDDLIRADEAAEADPSIKAIAYRAHTPGGDVVGCGEWADILFRRRETSAKLRWTYVEGMLASAGVWGLSQTTRIVAHETALVGWIGVVRTMVDDAKALEKFGVREIEIVSKHAGAKRSKPLDDEVIARAQTIADDLGDIFEGATARGRGVSAGTVASDFGGGDGMIAGKALAAGLIDEVSDFNSMLAALRGHAAQPVPRPAAPHAPLSARTKETTMAKQQHRAEGEPVDDKKAEGDKPEDKAKAEGDDKKCDKCGDAPCKCDKAEADEKEEKAKAEGGDHKEPDGDEGKKALASLSGLSASASVAQHKAAIEARTVPASKLGALQRQLDDLQAKDAAREKTARESSAKAWAAQAEADGRIAADKLGHFAALHAEHGAEFVEKIAEPKGTFHALRTYTANGNPTGKAPTEPTHFGAQGSQSRGAAFAAEIDKTMAADKSLSWERAAAKVQREQPALYADYLNGR